MQRKLLTGVLVSAGLLVGLYSLNASWLAPAPHGEPTVVAQRGVSQTYALDGADDSVCTARLIRTPVRPFIENTSPSIAAAFAAGADVVEVDMRMTRDFQESHSSRPLGRWLGSDKGSRWRVPGRLDPRASAGSDMWKPVGSAVCRTSVTTERS